jgi:hypothetical protein
MSGYPVLNPGLNNVGNYSVSGMPFVTGTLSLNAAGGVPLEISFPSVTQKIKILNNDATNAVKVGFSSNGVSNSNHFLVQPTATGNTNTLEMRVRATKIYLLSSGSAITGKVYVEAELTGITGYDLATVYSGNLGIG